MLNDKKFNSVVFAGGGSRCFWQLGFYDVVGDSQKISPKVVSAVSAGSAFATAVFAKRSKEVLSKFKEISAINEKNFYFSKLFSKEPAYPQYKMYREILNYCLDEKAYENLQKGPEIRVLLSRLPWYLGARSGVLVGMTAYNIEKKIFYPVHPKFATRLGYKPEIVPLQSCKNSDEVADLVLQSSCIPPIVPILKRGGKVVLDGGLVDNVPVVAIDENESDTLILLSRQYKEESIPKLSNRVYVQPSESLEIKRWDYSSPEKIQKTYDIGRKDGEAFFKKLES